MTRLFTEDEVRRIVAEAVAETIAPLKARIAELETENARFMAEVAKLKKISTRATRLRGASKTRPEVRRQNQSPPVVS